MKYFKKLIGKKVYLSPINVDDALLYVGVSRAKSILYVVGDSAYLEEIAKVAVR